MSARSTRRWCLAAQVFNKKNIKDLFVTWAVVLGKCLAKDEAKRKDKSAIFSALKVRQPDQRINEQGRSVHLYQGPVKSRRTSTLVRPPFFPLAALSCAGN